LEPAAIQTRISVTPLYGPNATRGTSAGQAWRHRHHRSYGAVRNHVGRVPACATVRVSRAGQLGAGAAPPASPAFGFSARSSVTSAAKRSSIPVP